MTVDLNNKVIPILSLGCMLIGVLFSYIYPKTDQRRNKANVIFVFGAAVLLANWLMQEQNILITIRENIGWTLLGLIITFVKVLRR